MIRLLIADDEKLEREALADMVSRRFEHEVVLELAENGRKAADTAVLWGADLILMDIEMPGMSGLDAARAVLAQRPACRVIFVTAYSLFQYAHEAVHLGACDYLLKPVTPTSWKPPSGGPCGRSRRSGSWKNWPERPSCLRSRKRLKSRKTRKKTLRRQSPLRAKTARPLWS